MMSKTAVKAVPLESRSWHVSNQQENGISCVSPQPTGNRGRNSGEVIQMSKRAKESHSSLSFLTGQTHTQLISGANS